MPGDAQEDGAGGCSPSLRRTTPHHLEQTPRGTRHLRCDAGRREVPRYETPQELLDMEERDPAGLRQRFKLALTHFHETGRLHASDLQLPHMNGPPPTHMWFIPGYEGGALDPEKLGVACIVVPPSTGRGPNTLGSWGLKPVPTTPFRSILPSCLPSSAIQTAPLPSSIC